MKLSIVIPCYNEENNLPDLIKEICTVFQKDFECIFVDDGSNDNTKEVLKELAVSNHLNCKVISFTRNFGKEAAIYAGLSECEGDYISLLDADLQQPPAMILSMLTILETNPGLDMVAAVQTTRQEPIFIQGCKQLFYKMMNYLSDFEFPANAGDFRTFRKNVGETVVSMKEYNRFSKGLFCWGGFHIYYLPYEAEKRRKGKSKWNFFRLVEYAIGGISSFSTRPLRIATLFGFLFLLSAVIAAIESYFAFLILLIGSVQLFCIGIAGEYIAGIFIQTKNRPPFLIREIYHYQEEKEETT